MFFSANKLRAQSDVSSSWAGREGGGRVKRSLPAEAGGGSNEISGRKFDEVGNAEKGRMEAHVQPPNIQHYKYSFIKEN